MKWNNFNFDENYLWEGARGFKKINNLLIYYYVCTANDKKYELIIEINGSKMTQILKIP